VHTAALAGQSVAVLRLFAAAREAAGTGRIEIEGDTVGAVLEAARTRFGPELAAVMQRCRIWRNGEPADEETPVSATDEVAILPPVSGG
jgi:MoaD family protein